MTRKGRVHLITAGLLLALVVLIIVLWSYPMILVWVLLLAMAVMAYGVLYLLVQSRVPKPDSDEADDLDDEGDDNEGPARDTARGTAPREGSAHTNTATAADVEDVSALPTSTTVQRPKARARRTKRSPAGES